MSGSHHAVVWIDHSEAKVFVFGGALETETDVHSHSSLQRLHHRRGGWEAGGNPPEDAEFYKRIMGALDPGASIVIIGPGHAKSAFKGFLDRYRPGVASHVLAIEMMDHPDTDALLALGRRYFTSSVATQPLGDAPPGDRVIDNA